MKEWLKWRLLYLRKLSALIGEWAQWLGLWFLLFAFIFVPPLLLLWLCDWMGWISYSQQKAAFFVFGWIALLIAWLWFLREILEHSRTVFMSLGRPREEERRSVLALIVDKLQQRPSTAASREEEDVRFFVSPDWMGWGTPEPPPFLRDGVSRPKQVRIGFSAKTSSETITDADILPRQQPLVAETNYYLRIDISAELHASNVINPTAIPIEILHRVPLGYPLDVIIESGDFEFGKGRRVVQRKLHLLKEQASEFLYLKIKTPAQPCVARLSVSVLYHNVRLQWLQTRARIVSAGVDAVNAERAPEPVPLGNESEVVYTISPTCSDFEDLLGNEVSLAFDEAAGLALIKGAGSKPFRTEVNLTNLRAALDRFRALLAELNESAPQVYRFFNDNRGSETELAEALLRLADLGRTLYDVICSGTELQQQLADRLKTPGRIEIALTPARNPVPWSALYDLPLLSAEDAQTLGKTRQSCMRWVLPAHQLDQRPDYRTCRSAADCPLHRPDGLSDLDYRDHVGSHVCVFGFWGYKHQLQQPAGAVSKTMDARRQPMPPEITFDERPQLSVFGNQQIAFYPPHRQTLAALTEQPPQPLVRIADDFSEIRRQLSEDREPHVIYLYCHGDFRGALPALVLGAENDFKLDQRQLEHLQTQWRHQPLVFINGCETVTAPASALMNLATLFNSRQAAGVIGTEIKVFPLLARWFGEEFVKRFLRGAPVGHIMRELRLELLNRYNPLGLCYTNYTLAGLRLKKNTASDSRCSAG